MAPSVTPRFEYPAPLLFNNSHLVPRKFKLIRVIYISARWCPRCRAINKGSTKSREFRKLAGNTWKRLLQENGTPPQLTGSMTEAVRFYVTASRQFMRKGLVKSDDLGGAPHTVTYVLKLI
jgi:hypothetical protein